MTNLNIKLSSIELRNPLILASGIYGSTFSSLERIFNAGLGAVVTKSIGIEPREGYQNPSAIYLPEISSIINAVGLANPGYVYFCKELANLSYDVKYIISLFGSSPKEFTQMIKHFQKNNLKPVAFELNLSCPHAKKVGMAVGTDSETVKNIVTSCKQKTKVPLWVKLTPNITDINKVAEAAAEGGADAIVAINTLKAILIDVNIRKPVLSNKRGGLSGKAIKPIGLRMIYDMYEYFTNRTIDIPLIGVGGIYSYRDVLEYILAGASAVQLGSVFSQNFAPETIIRRILSGIESYLEKEGLTFTQLRGLAHE